MHCHPAPECECDLKSVIGIPFSPAQKIRCGSLNPPPTRRIYLPIMISGHPVNKNTYYLPTSIVLSEKN